MSRPPNLQVELGGPTTSINAARSTVGRDQYITVGGTIVAGEQVEWPVKIGLPTPPTLFVGRDALVEAFADKLKPGCRLAVDGLPGVGKSTLAAVLARHERVLGRFPHGVLWTSLGPDGQPTVPLAQWCRALKLHGANNAGEQAAAIAAKLEHRQVLFVLDDVWDAAHAEALSCGGPDCGFLLTTRRRDIAHGFAGPNGRSDETLSELDEEAGFRLVSRLAPTATKADETGVRALVRSCGGLPIELELIGGYLRDAGGIIDDDVFAQLGNTAIEEMADPRIRLRTAVRRLGRSRGGEMLEDVVRLSLSDGALSESARKTFYALGAFAPDPESFTAEAAQRVAKTELRTLRELVLANLVRLREGRFSMHQTVAGVARANVPANAIQLHRDYYLDIIRRDRKDWRKIDAVYGQVRRAWAQAEPKTSKLGLLETLKDYLLARVLHDLFDWLEEALPLYRHMGDRRGEAVTLSYLGAVHAGYREIETALEYFRAALPIRREADTPRGVTETLNCMGEAYLGLGEMKKAKGFFEEALPLCRQIGDRLAEARTLANIGHACNHLGELTEALECYEAARPLCTDTKGSPVDVLEGARILFSIGVSYPGTAATAKAIETLEDALPLWREVGDRSNEALTHAVIGDIHRKLGEHKRAMEYLEVALPLWREVGDHFGEFRTHTAIGDIYRELGEHERAIERYETSLVVLREAGYDDLYDREVHSIIADIYSELGGYERALEYLKAKTGVTVVTLEGDRIREVEMGDRANESVALCLFGDGYRGLGKYERALERYEAVLSLCTEVGDPYTHSKIGDIYRKLGQHERALEYFEAALPLWTDAEDRYSKAEMLWTVGDIYRELGQHERALEHYEALPPIEREMGFRSREAAALYRVGDGYRELGEYERALERYEAALPIIREEGDRSIEALVLYCIARVYDELGEPAKALERYEAALPIIREEGDRSIEAKTHLRIARIHDADGRLEEAIAEMEEVVALDQATLHPGLESSNLVVLEQMKKRLAKELLKR